MTEQPMSRAELLAKAREQLAELDAEAERSRIGDLYQGPLRFTLRHCIAAIEADQEGETP